MKIGKIIVLLLIAGISVCFGGNDFYVKQDKIYWLKPLVFNGIEVDIISSTGTGIDFNSKAIRNIGNPTSSNDACNFGNLVSTANAALCFGMTEMAGSFDIPQDSTDSASAILLSFAIGGTSVPVPAITFVAGDLNWAWTQDIVDCKYDGNGMSWYVYWCSTYTVASSTCSFTLHYAVGDLITAFSDKASPIAATDGTAYKTFIATITLSNTDLPLSARGQFIKIGVTRDREINPSASINADVHTIGVKGVGKKSE